MTIKFSVNSPMRARKAGDYPAQPFVQLAAETGSLLALQQQGDQFIISAQLMTDQEIDEAIEGLIKDLIMLKESAKVELKRQNEAMRGIAKSGN